MAYGMKYVFAFQAINGDTYNIIVEKEGYSGQVIRRCLGGAPSLKRERNGHVCGSSLEFLAECQVDGEFAEFYTSDPLTFRVSMSGPSRTYFRGFISPELYSEPDIAPPYDVRVIATDGLGELRRYLFEPMGTQPLDIIITSLLERTGLPGYFFHNNNTLVGGEDSNVPVGGFFGDTYINLDCFAGKPCYDVLTGILDSLHADLFQRIEVSGEYWQILRENDVESGTSIVYGRSASSASTNRTVSTTLFGSMRTQPWWPVGHLDSDIKPACKRLKIITDALYGEGLDNAGIDSDAAWVKSSASYLSSQKAYQVTAQGGYIRQTVSFEVAVRRRLKLQVRLRQYRPTASSASSAGTASITVSMYGSTYGGTGTRYLTRNDLGELYWATEQASLSVDLPAPAYTDTEDNCTVFEVELPLFSGAPRNFARADSITVRITRDSATVPLLIHSASLTMAEQILGYQDIFTINNGARDDADDVRSMFLPALTGFYGTPVEFMCGVPKTLLGEVVNLFDPVGLDYAKSCCLPRLYKRGVLNVPSGADIPFVLRDSQGINYLIRSFDWNVLASEFDVEMLSRPAASVSVASQEISEETGAGGGGSSAGTSAIVSDAEAVRYTSQTLTSEQQAQARTNIGAGTSSVAPDQEDITTRSGDLLTLKDRAAGSVQLGYKILRTGATFASQVTDTNTIYEVRYPFDLNGATVVLPAGSVFVFDGGRISNGRLRCSTDVEIYDGEIRNCRLLVCGNLKLKDCSLILDTPETGYSAADRRDGCVILEDTAPVHTTADSYVEITGCTIKNLVQQYVYGCCIKLIADYHNIRFNISNNYLYNTYHACIESQVVGSLSCSGNVENNTIIMAGTVGQGEGLGVSLVAENSEIVVANNYIEARSICVEYCKDALISGNVIKALDHTAYAIQTSERAETAIDTQAGRKSTAAIIGNKILSGRVANIRTKTRTYIAGNEIHGLVLFDGRAEGQSAGGVGDFEVVGNTIIHDPSDAALYMAFNVLANGDSGRGVIRDNYIVDQNDNGSTPGGGWDMIMLNAASHVVMQNNTILCKKAKIQPIRINNPVDVDFSYNRIVIPILQATESNQGANGWFCAIHLSGSAAGKDITLTENVIDVKGWSGTSASTYPVYPYSDESGWLDQYGNIYEDGTTVKGFNDRRNGTTGQRPDLTRYKGLSRYYDTTIRQPIWWDGSAWRDASGGTV